MRLIIALLLICASANGQWAYSVNGNGLTALSYGGTSYLWNIGYIVYEYWTPPAGSEGSILSANMTGSSTGTDPTSVTQTYERGGEGRPWQLKVEYRGAGTDTLQLDIYITNNDDTDTLRVYFTPLAMTFPADLTFTHGDKFDLYQMIAAPPQYYVATLPAAGSHGTLYYVRDGATSTDCTVGGGSYRVLCYDTGSVWAPVAANMLANVAQAPNHYWAWSGGTMAAWGTYAEGVAWAQLLSGSGNRNLKIELQKNSFGTSDYRMAVAPGATAHYTLYVRRGDDSVARTTLAADSYTSYRAAIPPALNWTDRRPIGRMFMADRVYSNSNNPRGYRDVTDYTNSAQTRTQLLARVDDAINYMNGLTTKPQGIIMWDIEGQEFEHPFSYVGDPRLVPILAPEMDAVADEIFAKVRNAGYRVGITLRTGKILTGTTLPATCRTNVNSNLRDVFVKTDAAYPYRGYICNPEDVNYWVQEGAGKPAAQPDAWSYAELLSEISSKVEYAKRRWGVSIFYFDTNGYSTDGKRIEVRFWRDINALYPDVLFLPEHRYPTSYGFAAAYTLDQPLAITQTEPEVINLWGPQVFSMVGSEDTAEIKAAVMRGDSPNCECWFDYSGNQLQQAAYTQARVDSGVLTMTDSAISGNRTYTGDPRGACPPGVTCKMRVAFRADSSFDGNETTYCEKLDTVVCSSGNATLNLGSMTHTRIEYRDFHGRLVSAGLAAAK